MTTPREERNTIKKLIASHPLQSGEIWYPIHSRWWRQWTSYTSFEAEDSSRTESSENRPEPIDNSDLSSSTCPVKLREGLREGESFHLLHSAVWEKLLDWYGGGPAFPRKVVAKGINALEAVELYPFVGKIFTSTDTGDPGEDYTYAFFYPDDTLDSVLARGQNQDVRLWVERVSGVVTFWKLCSPTERGTAIQDLPVSSTEVCKILVETPVDGEFVRDLYPIGGFIDAFDKYNKWYESTIRDKKDGKIFVHYNGWPSKWDEWLDLETDAARIAPVYTHTSGAFVRKKNAPNSYSPGNDEEPSIQRGIVGLRNLGNTCFMNSTLQCLTATPIMRDYWLNDLYKADINRENPLGWNGKIADEYGALVKELWSNKRRVFSPRRFKQAIGEFAPRFSGYSQQDSSEILSFLLDGLHEDLNRVRKKPVTDQIDSNGRPDEVVAEESWKTHLKRHNSVIVDHFQGQFKSHIICPDCGRVSVTFDPYMFVSVPFPTNQFTVIQTSILLSNPEEKVREFGIKVAKHGTIHDLKKEIENVTGLDPGRCVIGEVWKSRMFKFYENHASIQDIRPGDEIWAFEVPGLEQYPNHGKKFVPKHALEYKLVQLVHFTKDTEDDSAASRYGHSVGIESFGVPLPVILPTGETVTVRDIEKVVEESLSGVFSDPASLPFKIWTMGSHGKMVKTCLTGAAADEEVDMSHCSLGLEWMDASAYNEKKFTDLIIDPSSLSAGGKTAGGEPVLTLGECLDTFTRVEKLSEENAWYCSACKEFRCATKQLSLWSVPDVLIIHLKRFEYTRTYRDRIDTLVNFPIRGLDLSAWVKDLGKGRVYDLYAVSNHSGGLGGGHYTAYCKSMIDGKWYELNDTYPSVIEEEKIVSEMAYVLFYMRRQ